jgi:predicted acylesterase/phospholipase RssA
MAALSLLERVANAIAAFADAVAARVAPALPWLFMALRRALIPTLVWLIVAAFFFVVPQSREVLHGLSEPMLKSFTEFDGNDRTSINVWALLSYVAAAVALGLGVWYSARLLSTVDADLGAPNALEKEPGSIGLQQATVWYARGLGVSALAAAIGALIYANYTPRLSQTLALGLALLAVVGPLLLAIGSLIATHEVPSAKGKPLIVLGLLAMAAAALLLVMLHAKWPMWSWSIASSMLPGLLLMFLVRRRRWIQRFHLGDGKDASSARRFGEVVITIVLLVLLSSAVLLGLALLPPVVVRGFGSAAAVLLFLAAASLLLSGAQIVFRRFASNVPGFTTAVLAIVALLIAFIGHEDLGSETLAPRPQALLNQPAATSAAAASAPTVPRALYVNAHGGGLRAAVFTAQVLARADDATCGAFGAQVAAFSGVSGGSVGIATYLLARQELVARGGWGSCAGAPAGTPAKTPLADIVTGTLVQDHLSLAISRMLAVDAPHLWGSPTRGKALLRSWDDALIASLGAHFTGTKADAFTGFALPLAALNGGFAKAPAVFFNATDADTGHIVWFSNGRDGIAATYNQQARPVELSVGQAVLHSARFPIVTPPGAFAAPWAPERASRLIDGGYADNSGTTTLFDVFVSGTPPHDTGTQPRMINIDGNPSADSVCEKQKEKKNPPILTGVRGLLQARSAHASRAVERLEHQTNTLRIDVRLDLEAALADPKITQDAVCAKVARAEQAPLGWYMSYEAAATVAKSAEFGVRGVCASLSMACGLAEVKVPIQQ